MSENKSFNPFPLPHVSLLNEDEAAVDGMPATQERPSRSRIVGWDIEQRIAEGAYMSADELQRIRARVRGYRDIFQHPSEIGSIDRQDLLVMDLNIVLFDDKTEAIRIALQTAHSGVPVGVHCYYLGDPDLNELRTEKYVVLEKTHRRVLKELDRRFR